jgi:hypothetical protein
VVEMADIDINYELMESRVARPTDWILSQNRADRLICVPTSLQLAPSPETLILSCAGRSPSFHFEKAALGDDWQNCYTPTP